MKRLQGFEQADLCYEAEVVGSIPAPGTKRRKMRDLYSEIRRAEKRYYIATTVSLVLSAVVVVTLLFGWVFWL